MPHKAPTASRWSNLPTGTSCPSGEANCGGTLPCNTTLPRPADRWTTRRAEPAAARSRRRRSASGRVLLGIIFSGTATLFSI